MTAHERSLYLLVPVLFFCNMLDTRGYLIKHQLLGYPFTSFTKRWVCWKSPSSAALKFTDVYKSVLAKYISNLIVKNLSHSTHKSSNQLINKPIIETFSKIQYSLELLKQLLHLRSKSLT